MDWRWVEAARDGHVRRVPDRSLMMDSVAIIDLACERAICIIRELPADLVRVSPERLDRVDAGAGELAASLVGRLGVAMGADPSCCIRLILDTGRVCAAFRQVATRPSVPNGVVTHDVLLARRSQSVHGVERSGSAAPPPRAASIMPLGW